MSRHCHIDQYAIRITLINNKKLEFYFKQLIYGFFTYARIKTVIFISRFIGQVYTFLCHEKTQCLKEHFSALHMKSKVDSITLLYFKNFLEEIP